MPKLTTAATVTAAMVATATMTAST
ncbi:unnamed protein product, partial [Rotaria magnacalcarata]